MISPIRLLYQKVYNGERANFLSYCKILRNEVNFLPFAERSVFQGCFEGLGQNMPFPKFFRYEVLHAKEHFPLRFPVNDFHGRSAFCAAGT